MIYFNNIRIFSAIVLRVPYYGSSVSIPLMFPNPLCFLNVPYIFTILVKFREQLTNSFMFLSFFFSQNASYVSTIFEFSAELLEI